MRGTLITDGQTLSETWRFEYEPLPLHHRGPDRIRGRMVWWPNSTHYASSVIGPDVETVRLNMVLALARAICQDESAYKYDEDEIHKANTLAWFKSRMEELENEFDIEDLTTKQARKLRRQIKFLEMLMGIWQEEHDYWPEEEDAKQIQAVEKARARTAALRDARNRDAASPRADEEPAEAAGA